MEISDPIVMTVAGGIVTTLTATITALWVKVGRLEDKNDGLQAAYQIKIEAMVKQLTEVMITATNQTNTYTNSMTNLATTMTQFQDKMITSFTSLRETLLTAKKE